MPSFGLRTLNKIFSSLSGKQLSVTPLACDE